MAFETKKLFFVEACTGCSCCKHENSIQGPYFTEAEAKDMAQIMYNQAYVYSQYSPNGEYSLYSQECEILPDGRMLVGKYVLDDDKGGFIEHSHYMECMNLTLEKSSSTNWFLE
jgi:hypothetical protein